MSRQFHRVEFGSRQAARPPQPEPEPQDNSEPPSDSMLVPVDQWNRILGQLGNIHEAGQQLADARERAARAETENHFLKERLAELRQRAEEAHPVPGLPEPEPEPAPRRFRVELSLPRWLPTRRR